MERCRKCDKEILYPVRIVISVELKGHSITERHAKTCCECARASLDGFLDMVMVFENEEDEP